MKNLFRDGIINLNTRQIGTVAELLIQLLGGYQLSKTIDFDLEEPKKAKENRN